MVLMEKVLSFLQRKNTVIVCLLLIALLGLAVRLYRLDQAPYGALVDEMHFGYIAYSLVETGRDEHGVSWPLVFKGFGDYKLPAYAYLLVPFIALFDLSVMTIRLPSVLIGTINIILMYVVARSFKISIWASLLAAVVMAFSPWPFILSRFGFESNLGLLFWLVGLWLLGTVTEANSTLRKILTGFSFALPWYAYIAFRPITLFILVVYCLYSWWQKKLNFKTVAIILATFFLAIIPMQLPGVGSANTARFKQIGILSDPGIAMNVDEQRTFCSWQAPKVWCYLLWNKPTVVGQNLINRFIKVYSPEFLAVQGELDPAYLSVKGFGQFSYVLYPLFILGLISLVVSKSSATQQLSAQHRLLLLTGLTVSVVPAILSGEPQRVRLSAALPFFILTIVFGSLYLSEVMETLSKIFVDAKLYQKLKTYIMSVVLLVLGSVFIFNTLQYLTDYYYIYTVKNNIMYVSYVRDLMTHLKQYESTHKIFFKPYFPDQMMFYAFYTKYDPKTYQEKAVLGGLEASGFQHTVALDTLEVSEDLLGAHGCTALENNQPTLFVTNLEERGGVDPVYTVSSANGVDVLSFVYDAYEYGRINVANCTNIPADEKARILKEVAAQKAAL